MALPALAIPLILTGARTIVHRAAPIAMKLIKEGGAKRATDVIKELTSAITKSSGAGRTPVIAKGSRKVLSKSADEAASLIKAGKADSAQKVLNSMTQGVKTAGKRREQVIRSKVGEAVAQRKRGPKWKGHYRPAKKAAAAAKKKATTATPTPTTTTSKKTPNLLFPGSGRIPKSSRTTTQITPKKPKSKTGLKELGIIGGVVGAASLLDSGGRGTKSVTVKSGDTLSQIAKDNNTTIAAIKKANPSITNIHLIHAGQTIKVPKVKDRKSVYQGMTSAELQQPKKTTTATKIKYGPPGTYGASKSGGMIKRSSGGKSKKYAGGGPLKGSRQQMSLSIQKPIKKNPWGAAIKGKGKGYKKNAF